MNIARKGVPIKSLGMETEKAWGDFNALIQLFSAPYNPINNVADPSVLNCIADAMAEIESNDLRVDKIILEKDRYDELITKKDNLDYLCKNDYITEEEALIGTLWGARLEIGEKSKVYSERGFIPSGLYDESNMHDLNWCMDRVIKFNTLSSDPFKRKLQQLKRNLTIIVKSRASPIFNISQNEQVAIDTLREMITETDFRKYLIHGFILVKGCSGRVYQVFRDRHHTKVWENGELVEEVCVRVKDSRIPLTDNLIAFKIMIESDENEFRKLGNVYNMRRAAA